MSIDIGQIEEADDVIASLNALLMEEKQRREEAEQHRDGALQIMYAAEEALAGRLRECRELEDELHATTREVWTLHDKLKMEEQRHEETRQLLKRANSMVETLLYVVQVLEGEDGTARD